MEVMPIMFTGQHTEGSTLRQEEESAPDRTGSLPSSALVEGPPLQPCCLPTHRSSEEMTAVPPSPAAFIIS